MCATAATGTAEREAAVELLTPARRARTIGGDKNYDVAAFVAAARDLAITPHVAQNLTRRGGSAIDGRTTRQAGYAKESREKRVEGILGNSRRQHYGHAALLVASCIAYAPKKRVAPLLRWAMDLRLQYWRRHAFREELTRACESLGVLMPA
jgi:hypothetical protein